MAPLVLCCGKVASGKSSFARVLATNHGFFHFSADDWMLHFYQPTPDRALFEANQGRCVEMIYRLSQQLLDHGQPVVLDFGYWKKADRETARRRFETAGHRVHLVYFPIEMERQLLYLDRRQADPGIKHYHFDRQTVATLNDFFEDPKDEDMVSPDEFLASLG